MSAARGAVLVAIGTVVAGGAVAAVALTTHVPDPDAAQTVAIADGGGSDAGSGSGRSPTPDARRPSPFAELARYPHTEAVRTISLPIRADMPRFDIGGPALTGAVAAVSSSQFGFLGVDWRAGQVAWSKPAGDHVAPPLARPGGFVLIGDCVAPPAVGEHEMLIGCLRSVTTTGEDQIYVAIHGEAAALAPFASEYGAQKLWWTGEHALTWRRGERAVAVDSLTGLATPIAAGAPASSDPPLVAEWRGKRWDISRTADGSIEGVGAGKTAAPAWRTDHPYTDVLAIVRIPDESPMVRAIRLGHYGGDSEMTLFDIDATGSLHGQVAFPVPAIGVLGHAASSVGDVAIALRLDKSLAHDYVVGYAASSLLMYVYPLPEIERTDPVGVAVAPDGVIVFHDGDTLTVLPELSAPPSAPGAALAPSEEGE